jgi:hypothetical protein
MGKRGKKVICALVQPSIDVEMLIASRVDEDEEEAASDGAAVEQTTLGGRGQIRVISIVTTIDSKSITMDLRSWMGRKSRDFGMPCVVTYQTASDSLALKRNAVRLIACGLH